MADGEGKASPAMAEMKKRVCDDIAGDSGGKRPRTADRFDELEASRPSPAMPKPLPTLPHHPNGVNFRDEEIATAEVVNAGNASGSAAEDPGEEMRSDVEEDEFVDESDSDEEEDDEDEEEDEDEDDDYYSDSDVDAQLGSSNPPRRIEKGIVLDKGKNKVASSGGGGSTANPHDYKGKGKAIVQDDDEDSSSDDSEVGVEGDEMMFQAKVAAMAGDALEDVDLNNILPTRTRRRTIQQPLPPPPGDDAGNGSSDEDEDYVAGDGGGDSRVSMN